MAVLLIVGGTVSEVRAAKVTYHILTLPINPSNYDYHMKSDITGYRLEAVKVVVDNQNTVELPAHYKSPLATDFTYYEPKDIIGRSSAAVSLFDNGTMKGVRYKVKSVDTDDTPAAVAVAEGTAITTSTAEYYVIYTYNASNGIAQLDGSENYNISVANKGFLALNRGRNNRPAVIPKEKVTSEMLTSADFSYIANPHKDITTYWNSGDNKNSKDSAEAKFFFGFTLEGKDPYHIVVKTTYARPYTYIEKNEDTKKFVYKWFKGSVLMAATTGNAYIASDDHICYSTEWVSGSANTQSPAYDARTGYYHGNNSNWSTVALLNNTSNTGYVFMGTRTVDNNGAVPATPYYLKFTNNNNINFGQISAAEATKNHTVSGFYPLRKVTFKVATPFYAVSATSAHIISAEAHVSQYTVENDPIEVKHLPASLRRKYCNFTGKFYKDAACTNEITRFSEFSDVEYDEGGEGYTVYVGYELTSTIPFKPITPASSYDSTVWNQTTWYELTDEGSTEAYGRKIKYDGSSAYKNNGASGEYVKESEFAFVGDPYELKVVNRKATAAASGTATYVTLGSYSAWDIPEDNADFGGFLLHEYSDAGHWYWDAGQPVVDTVTYGSNGSKSVYEEAQTVTIPVKGLNGSKYYTVAIGGADAGQIVSVSPAAGSVYPETGTTVTVTVRLAANTTEDAKTMTVTVQEYTNEEGETPVGTASVITLTQGTSSASFAGNAVSCSPTYSTRVKVMELPKKHFTYQVVDTAGHIAIKATVAQTMFSPISGYTSIPEVIRSPFLVDETVTFWRTYTAGTCTNRIVETSNTEGDNIYVTYTVSHLANKSIKLNNTQQFKVKLNDEHIYFSPTYSKILSSPEVLSADTFLWSLEGSDPYSMKIRNAGKDEYVKVHEGTWDDDAALDFVAGVSNGSRFIAMMSIYPGVYEVLAATGNSDYYHIGRSSSSGAETKVYSTGTYAHGTNALRFELAGEDAIIYHLIDHSKEELLDVSSFNPRLTLPAEYVSPLVKEYYYYPTRAKALTNLPGDRITEPKEDTDESGATPGDNQIYVRYVANELVAFNTGAYMLRFLEPHAYRLEDGNDNLTEATIEAMYPYCNGDGNLNIYGNDLQKEQFGGGASTRPRWVWYFDTENDDPYHVRIRSKSTITYKDIKHPTYLTTYAVHFHQDTGEDADKLRIVTGGTLPGPASAEPTEYMVLGTPGNYRLMTTKAISDGNTTVRRNVTSLEQYWKTYNMIKLNVLGVLSSTDDFDDVWEVPETPSSYRTTLTDMGWHSYDAYANATRWNGYNDKTNGHEKKVVEKLEHWFQTFDMGTGTFDIESADIPPVLVLLDRHGWEIMRRPLPPNATYPEGEELAELRVYDSPLVDKYYFYSNATKASGCHKYTLRLNDKGEERDQIKVNGTHYSATSLADLPPKSASGVVSGGAIQDFYVIYTVKEEYEHNYYYSLNESTTPYTETGTSQPYLVLQNGRFYKTENNNKDKAYFSKPVFEYTNPEGGNVYDLIVSPCNPANPESHPPILDGSGNFRGNNFWYVKPNLNIDEEMGIPWTKVTGETVTAQARDTLRKAYKDKMGFDPYNIQLQLKSKDNGSADGRYLTTHMDTAVLNNGIMVGSYSRSADTTLVTLAAAGAATIDGEGYDHTTLQITNQTFMAVSDINGNMQLMPRFDHTKRVSLDKVKPWLSQLYAPEDHPKAKVEDNNSMGRQTTFFVCPQRFHYHIIDNNGREALGYKRGADFYPAITDHFKSPLAKDFTFYTGLAEYGDSVTCTKGEWDAAQGEFKRSLTRDTLYGDAVKILPSAGTYYYQIGTRGNFKWRKVTVTKGLLEQQITGSFADAHVTGIDTTVYVRYKYDMDADMDADRVLQGQWFTVQLSEKDLKATGTVSVPEGASQGTGVSLLTGSKPGTIDADAKEWQWKFLAAPTDPSSDYYVEPDPYAVQLFNRNANYTKSPSEEPSPMAVGIKVPNNNGGADRFALLSHPNGGYALAVAKEYDRTYRYQFLNGAGMTTSVAADTVGDAGVTYKSGAIAAGAQVLVNDDVKHLFTYRVITNDSLLAITTTQTEEEALTHRFAPYLPDTAQSPLLNLEDYKYYGFASRPKGKYGVIPQTILYTLSGLYDDTVYVRYAAYDMDKTSFKVPNQKTVVDSHVARDASSVDVSMNINGGLPYNIVWYNDNTMKSTNDADVTYETSLDGLSGNKEFVWYFTGNDPYSLRIQHKGGKYLDGDGTMEADSASAPAFMLLRKPDYDYGVLQKTGLADRLTGYGQTTTTVAPTKYIIFGLSIHDLIYHLIIANSGKTVDIDYRETKAGTLTTKTIHGTTQRDLVTKENAGNLPGSKYQLGDTVKWNSIYHTYSHHAGSVSIGDDLVVPNEFSRPNCTFDFYVEGVYSYSKTPADNDLPIDDLNNKYKGLKLTKLMSDEDLINQTVVVNIVYSFDTDVATNTGLGFVTDTAQHLWYSFETYDGTTPYLAQYTNAWGLQSKEGRATHYTNDYLWTPLGDVYGFTMYNRYMLKNTVDGEDKVMTVKAFAENDTLLLAEPGTGGFTAGYEIFELVAGDAAGYFRVHPVANDGATKYYVWRDPTDNYTKLSTTPCDWRFGLDRAMLEPYYIAAGYVGGLTPAGKAAYESAVLSDSITNIQKVVYNSANIVHYKPGYYRLHNQPGVSGIDPVRYASGYLHNIEKTAVSGGIPMHFYSRSGVRATFAGIEDGLGSGFKETAATRGEIPIDSTEIDPSTIFYFSGTDTYENNPRSTIRTQGLYVAANANGDAANGTGNNKNQRAVMTDNSANAITFSIMDIGGATLLIHDGEAPATRRYLNYDQTKADSIYDLKFYHNAPTDDAKWCMQPVQKDHTPGDGEMPLQLITHNGGDGYYYTTFFAPFDVLLPDNDGDYTYYAYTCAKWYSDAVHPEPVPAHAPYAEGKFVPAETPVIIRVKDESGVLTLTLPGNAPASPSPLSCVFSGQYLEQLLAPDAAHDVYTLGVPMTSSASIDRSTGAVTAPLPDFASTGVGFYINATPNKEDDPKQSLWHRNNNYVLHNKIYYRATGGRASAPEHQQTPEFVPLVFDDEQEETGDGLQVTGDGVYDLLGRKVATAQEASDGTWYLRLNPGVYIVNGRKIYLR